MPWTIFTDVQEYLHYFFVFKDHVFISEKPTEIYFKGTRLHNEKGMAVKYSDGWGLYSINGMSVPSWLVETPAEQIDPQKALDEKNADVQREIIRKVGYERVMKVAGAKTIDDWIDTKTGLKYSLKVMTIGSNINRRFLCYEHASVPGIYYAKPVPLECDKCWQARAFQLSVLDREQIKGAKEEEVLAKLPDWVA